MLGFEEMGKPENPKKNLSEKGGWGGGGINNKPAPNKTYMYFICMLNISAFIYAHIMHLYTIP